MIATTPTMPPIVSAEIVMLPVDQVDAHPANPKHRSTKEGVDDLLQLLVDYGQQEAGEVRQLPSGRYQLLKGHRRHAALTLLGETHFRAVVVDVDVDDAEALRRVAVGNAGREDLTPIERAELLQLMIENGENPHYAGRAFGLESESAVKNVLRLLKLPECIRDLVADGTLPQRQARYFVPYAEAEVWLKKLADEIKHNPRRFSECSDIAAWAGRELRVADGKTEYYVHWQLGYHPMRFEMTDALRERQQVVDLPAGPKGASIPCAQNVKLFDKLNLAAVKKYVAAQSKAKAKGTKGSSKLAKEPTAAELKEKAKKQAEQLKRARGDWAHHFQRYLLATQTPAGSPLITSTLPWLVAGADQPYYWIRSALLSLDNVVKSVSFSTNHCQLVSESIGDFHLTDRLWRILVYPQWLDWPGKVKHSKAADRLTDDYPERLPVPAVSYNDFEGGWREVLAAAELDLVAGWRGLGAKDLPAPAAMLWSKLMRIHNTEQLRQQCKDWKLKLDCGPKRSDLVAAITAAHATKPLSVPKFLTLSPSKRGAKK